MRAELLYQHGVPPQATYLFKHALIRDAAYTSLLHATRQQVHRRLITVCGTAFPHLAATQPELLAHHATAAGLLPEALEFWQRAGTQACQRGAYPEALAHLYQGLAVLARLPDGPERLRHELTLSLALAPVMFAVEGAGSPEVERLASRVYALSQQVEAPPQLFPALRGLQYVAWTQGQLAIAQELAGQLLALAQTSVDASQLLEAHLALGTTLWSQGRCVVALAHLERGLAHGDPARRPTYERVPHPELACLLYSGLVLWSLGLCRAGAEAYRGGCGPGPAVAPAVPPGVGPASWRLVLSALSPDRARPGVDRVVLGSDWPFVAWDPSPGGWVQSLPSLSTAEKDKILWQNVEELLGLGSAPSGHSTRG